MAAIRNALSAQEDQSAVIVLAGPPVNLLGLLNLPGGSELAEAKVRELVLTEESLTDLIERWPSRVVVAGEDLSLRYPATSIEEDLEWATDHPVIDAYRAAGITNDPSVHAAAAVLYALHPDGGYFGSSEMVPGRPYRKLTADAGQRERALGEIRTLVRARPPEPRQGRGG